MGKHTYLQVYEYCIARFHLATHPTWLMLWFDLYVEAFSRHEREGG